MSLGSALIRAMSSPTFASSTAGTALLAWATWLAPGVAAGVPLTIALTPKNRPTAAIAVTPPRKSFFQMFDSAATGAASGAAARVGAGATGRARLPCGFMSSCTLGVTIA